MYPSFEDAVCSVIEHEMSYGNDRDLLEIRGLLTVKEMEREQDDVLGYLSARNVFGRIKRHYNKDKKKHIEKGM